MILRKVFDLFNVYDAVIGSYTVDYGYSDDGATFSELLTVKADIQPCGSALAEKEYGFKEECEFRMFTKSRDPCIKVGNAIKCGAFFLGTDVPLDDKTELSGEEPIYRIVHVVSWELGKVALLRKT